MRSMHPSALVGTGTRATGALAAVLLASACDRGPTTAPTSVGALAANREAGTRGRLPDAYVIPGATAFPEGIAHDERTGAIYVTSTTDGTVFRGDTRGSVRDSVLTVFLPGGADGRRTALGIAVDPLRQRLFVAGGATGRVFAYDARSRALLGSLAVGPSPAFVNDVAVARDGTAYATDSQNPVLYRVTADGATFRLDRWLDLTGTPIRYQPGFNLNGIEATEDGRYLFTVQSNTGRLYRIDTRTRAVVEVDLGGALLTNGDGLLLRGATLYAVQNMLGVVAEVRLRGLASPAPSGRVVERIADASFRFPTTVEQTRGRLLVVNLQFDRIENPAGPELPFTVSVVEADSRR